MQRDNLDYHIALANLPGIGPRKFAALYQQFPNLSDFFTLSDSELEERKISAKLLAKRQQADWQLAKQCRAWQDQPGQHIIDLTHASYPELLRQIHDPPPILYAKGDLSLLNNQQIAIVGSRKASHLGCQMATQFASELSKAGFTVTSGLALGIDAASHLGALQGEGSTIAVLGSGLNHIYPHNHRQMAAQIAQNGLLLSEFHPDTSPRAENFPRRNRIISGLSLAVLVVEATLRSGSLITARLANEQGRDVFAIPGCIQSLQSQGCHFLLKQGASLVESAQDIVNELTLFDRATVTHQPAIKKPLNINKLDSDARKILTAVDFISTPFDVIIERTQLPTQSVLSTLTQLELAGYVAQNAGGYEKLDNQQS